jgi:hypothetical protein
VNPNHEQISTELQRRIDEAEAHAARCDDANGLHYLSLSLWSIAMPILAMTVGWFL